MNHAKSHIETIRQGDYTQREEKLYVALAENLDENVTFPKIKIQENGDSCHDFIFIVFLLKHLCHVTDNLH